MSAGKSRTLAALPLILGDKCKDPPRHASFDRFMFGVLK
jgi:hypothetical protein